MHDDHDELEDVIIVNCNHLRPSHLNEGCHLMQQQTDILWTPSPFKIIAFREYEVKATL